MLTSLTEGDFTGRRKIMCKGSRVDAVTFDCVDRLLGQMWEDGEKSFWRLNCLVYAGAVTVQELLANARPKGGMSPQGKAQRSIRKKEVQVLELRKHIGWLTCEVDRQKSLHKPTRRQWVIGSFLCQLFGRKTLPEFRTALEAQKGILKVRALQKRRTRKAQNNRAQRVRLERHGLHSLERRCTTEQVQPVESEVKRFWNGVLGNSGVFDDSHQPY